MLFYSHIIECNVSLESENRTFGGRFNFRLRNQHRQARNAETRGKEPSLTRQESLTSRRSSGAQVLDERSGLDKAGRKELSDSALLNNTEHTIEGGEDLLAVPPPWRQYGKTKNEKSQNLEVPNILGSPYFWDMRGRLRFDCECIEFEWPDGSFLGYRRYLGRVYHDSFFFQGASFNVGDFVWVTQGGERYLSRIISAFQATRSFIGYWDSRRRKRELQKRGLYNKIVYLTGFHLFSLIL